MGRVSNFGEPGNQVYLVPSNFSAAVVPMATMYFVWSKARIPRRRHRHRHPREDRREDIGVGVVECGLYPSRAVLKHPQPRIRTRYT